MKLARAEALATRDTTKAKDIPADVARIPCESHPMRLLCACAVEHDARLRQPFQLRTACHVQLAALLSRATPGAIPLGGTRRRDHCVGTRFNIDPHFELIAARDTTGRMDQRCVADRHAFWIERLLHDQRPIVAPMRKHRARLTCSRELELQACLPAE